MQGKMKNFWYVIRGKKRKRRLESMMTSFLKPTIQGENWPSQGEAKVKQDEFVKWLRCPKSKPRRLEPETNDITNSAIVDQSHTQDSHIPMGSLHGLPKEQ